MDTPDRLSTLSFAMSVEPAVMPTEDQGEYSRDDDGAIMPVFPSHIRCVLTVDGKAYTDGLLDSSVFLAGPDLPRASFYLFTCGCGVPGCNGYFEEMVQTRADGRVVWDVPADDGLAKDLGGTRFFFEETAFEAARQEAVAALLAYETQGLHLASRIDHQGRVYNTFLKSIEHFRAWTQREAALHARIEAAIDPSLPRTLPSFDGEMPPHPEQVRDSDVGSLAMIVLNCGRAPDPESYRDRLDALPALIALFQTFADGGDADRATQALLPYWRFMQKDGVYNPARPDVAFVLLPGPDGGPRPAVQHLF